MINKSKILYFLDIFPTISETFIINEILELESRGYEILIFSRKKENGLSHSIVDKIKARISYLPDAHNLKNTDIVPSHIKILFLHPVNYLKTFFFSLKRKEKGLFWFFKIACVYADLAREYEFSHIHSHFASLASEYAMLVAKLLGKPFTFTIHGWYDLYEAPPADLYERAIAAKKVITISQFNKNYFINKFNIPSEKIEVIHSGVDLEYFKNDIGSEFSRKSGFPQIAGKVHSSEKNKIILSVARLHPVKCLDTLIKACAKLNSGIKFQCLIIGEGKDRNNLERLITEYGLNDKVYLLGVKQLEEVREYYKKADVFVLPSRHETMGVTTMEAMASSIPVISTNVYGIPELVDHQVNGFLVEPGDEEQLAFFLEETLKNSSKSKEMGIKGRDKIESEFNLKKEIDKLEKVWFDGKN